MITIKTPEEIKIMAEGGKILAKIMRELEKKIRPGITTKELDRLAESLILKSGGKCSFKGYKDSDGYSAIPFPACLCTSINEEIVHVAPSNRVLKEGDIISLDLGILYKGFHTDMAITLPVTSPPQVSSKFGRASPGLVGKIDPEVARLIRVTKKALKRGIKKARIGNTFGDIGNTIQRYVESQGFNVVRDLCGHGIGKEVHEEPKILNYGKRRTGPEIKEGMVFCIEPMVTVGDWHIKRTKNGFGYQTEDGFLSAHFEHTLAATKNGCQILTELK